MVPDPHHLREIAQAEAHIDEVWDVPFFKKYRRTDKSHKIGIVLPVLLPCNLIIIKFFRYDNAIKTPKRFYQQYHWLFGYRHYSKHLFRSCSNYDDFNARAYITTNAFCNDHSGFLQPAQCVDSNGAKAAAYF